MLQPALYRPARPLGIAFHIVLAALLAAGGLWGLLRAARAEVGPAFLLYLAPALVAVGTGPLLAYRLYSLLGGTYALERDGIYLRWGLRSEVLPMDQVEWVSKASNLQGRLPLPWFRWPGAVVGVRNVPGGLPLEFMAADTSRLVVVAARRRWFAISPGNPDEFMAAYQRLTELGSLSPLPAQSIYPTFLVARLWADRPARVLILGGILLNLLLLSGVSLAVPGREQVYLHLRLAGRADELVPSVQLLLLPVLSGFFFAADLVVGMFFYRRTVDRPADWHQEQSLSYLLWTAGLLTPAIFLAAAIMILQAS